MKTDDPAPLVHLELHTGDVSRASGFYAALCGWRPEPIETRWGGYLALELCRSVGGGMVQCPTARPLWLPYVEVADIGGAIERARRLGAAVLLGPREGPTGWRGVVAAPDAAEIALWQPKRPQTAGGSVSG